MDARYLLSALYLLIWIPSLPADTGVSLGNDHPMGQRLFNIERIWNFMAVFDFDENRINPAIVDMGFLDDDGARSGGRECMITHAPGAESTAVNCSTTIYGEYGGVARWDDLHADHGNHVKNTIAGTIDNADTAGVAGQVAVPNLYRLDDVHGHLYELNTAINRAVDDGSASVNISGGFPCLIPRMGSEETDYDICDDAGRAAFCASGSAYQRLGKIAARICMQSANEGDIRQLVNASVAYARDRGVPIVAAADNFSVDALQSLAQDQTSTGGAASADEFQAWDIMPANAQGVITVGGLSLPSTGEPSVRISGLQGDRINIWAPETRRGAASAFVSGLISLAQAINPRLSRDNGSLDDEAIKQIPVLISAWLEDTAYRDDELVAKIINNGGNPERVINPYRFIRKAAETTVPAFERLGYSDSFDTGTGASRNSQSEADPQIVEVVANSDITHAGTITYLPDASRSAADVDWYRLNYAALEDDAQYITQFELRYLNGYGDLEVASPQGLVTQTDEWVDGDERIRQYQSQQILDGASVLVSVNGVSEQDDNLYKFSVSQANTQNAIADRFDRSDNNDNNDTAKTATAISPQFKDAHTVQYVSPRAARVQIRGLSLHSLTDVDVFRVNGYPHPRGNTNYSVRYSVSANNPAIALSVYDAKGNPKHLGIDNSLILAKSRPLFIHAKRSDSDVFEAYDLQIDIETEQY